MLEIFVKAIGQARCIFDDDPMSPSHILQRIFKGL